MFKNYLLSAFRNFRRNKFFSLINISGLAVGISASLVIYLIVHYEFSYDKHHKDGERIYRVVTNMHFPGQDFKNSGVPGPLPAALRSEITGVEASTYFWRAKETKVTVPGKAGNNSVFRKQKDIIYADDQYFGFIKYKWLVGSPLNALSEPNRVVLTESRVKQYFSFADMKEAVGQTIIYDDSVNAVVSGIVKDPEEITDLVSKEFISLPTYIESLKSNEGWEKWGSVSSSSQFLIKLKKGVDPKSINRQLAAVRNKHKKDAYLSTDHFLQPLSDIHFNPDFDAFDQRKGHKPTLYGLLAVAAFLLLLGCINFINLTTAQTAQRAKEIGVRKTMGSTKSNLIAQFLTETFLLTVAATILSIVLIPWILKIFSDFIPPGLNLQMIGQPVIIGFIIVLVLTVSLFSGFYPALILSKYRPVTVLKNVAFANSSQDRRVWIRKTLTVSQFVIAQFFIMATIVVGKQIKFSLDRDMGFKKDAIITFSTHYDFKNEGSKQAVLRDKLRAIPGIENLSLSQEPPASNNYSITTLKYNNNREEKETTVQEMQVDTAYFGLYKMKLLAGRSLEMSDTVKEYVINETYAKLLGFKNPADVIGQILNHGENKKVPVVGVIADFQTGSTHSAIPPLAFTCQMKRHCGFHIALPEKAGADAWTSTIAEIGKKFKEVYPEEDFKYSFFDEDIAKFYKKEQDISRLLNWSTGLAVFISCLGLLGLVIYTTTQRVKEIGVRKVLGASVSQIVTLFSKDFLRLVMLAFMIAAPLAWWAMNKWLEDFAFRTAISWWVFVLSGVMMLLIALLTLSLQTFRSATVNPVKSLRTE